MHWYVLLHTHTKINVKISYERLIESATIKLVSRIGQCKPIYPLIRPPAGRIKGIILKVRNVAQIPHLYLSTLYGHLHKRRWSFTGFSYAHLLLS